MKIKNVTIAQAELNDKEIEILSKTKHYCRGQVDCCTCIFNKGEENCIMTYVWAELRKWNVKYDDIK